jgi:hypothetical protein
MQRTERICSYLSSLNIFGPSFTFGIHHLFSSSQSSLFFSTSPYWHLMNKTKSQVVTYEKTMGIS